MKLAHRLRHQLERHGFEVCSRLADRLGMRARPVRLFFIYISFFSLGFGFAVYLVLAFWLRLKDLITPKELQFLIYNHSYETHHFNSHFPIYI